MRETVEKLSNLEQLDFKQKRGVGRNHAACTVGAVAEIGWNQQRATTTNLHAGDTLFPTADNLPGTEAKGKGLAAIERAIELRSALALRPEPASVVHDAVVSWLRFGSASDLLIFELQAAGGRCHRHARTLTL